MRTLIVLVVSLACFIKCSESHFKEVPSTEQSKNSEDHSILTVDDSWNGFPGQEHITRLNSSTFIPFTSQNASFVMFYANECKSSKEAKPEFAKIAQEMAYTEGFTHVNFGALDCDATLTNKYICQKSLGISEYPRFIYFKNGTYHRLYPTSCANHADNFYSWLVNEEQEGNAKLYCSSSGSGDSSGGVVYNFMTSSSSSSSLPSSLHVAAATASKWPFFYSSSSSSSKTSPLLISLTFILVPFYLMKCFMLFS